MNLSYTLDWKGAASIETAGPALVVGDSFGFTEGPVWLGKKETWLFSDITKSTMWSWQPQDLPSPWRQPSNKANGNTLDPEGRVVTCEHATSRVVRQESDGTISVLAESFNGRRLNSPNDAVCASDGTILFSDPRYGLGADFGVEREQELDFQGVYLLRDGNLRLIDRDFSEPNGLCLSPDERTLYVNDSERGLIKRYRIGDDWSIGDAEQFATPPSDEKGVPDGMKCDRHGNVWCTGSGGIWIFDPDGGAIGQLRTPEIPVNFAFGGNKGNELLIAAGSTVLWQNMADSLAIPLEGQIQ
ncbi:SMP-30/gluconolactonase/LRE family protein [Arthrobacter sp. R4-81]